MANEDDRKSPYAKASQDGSSIKGRNGTSAVANGPNIKHPIQSIPTLSSV